ncbi:MAG: ABC transporter permease [Chloroflexi bacterium]|nr:ABC transporter permease [Chloroflexota bacterium]
MTRLSSTIQWDMRLQFRNGFYYASAFVAVLSSLILGQFPNADFAFILPMILFANLLINTFYFVAALVLLEKGEGSLEGLIVSPLRKWEYLVSKVVTLTFLSILESLLITLILYGFGFNWLSFLLGIISVCAMYTLVGFAFVARYDSINTFLFPSFIFTTVLSLPLIDYLGLWQTPFIYLHPFQAPILLLKGSFQPIETWQFVYGVLYTAVCTTIFFIYSHRAFYRFVILKQGVR